MAKNDWSALFVMEKVLSVVVPRETANMYAEACVMFSIRDSTKPFLSLQVPNFSWDQMFL